MSANHLREMATTMQKTFLPIALIFPFLLSAQTDSIVHRLFLIGDAGELKSGRQPLLDWLSKNVDWNDEKNIALYLGDNIYPDGLPAEGDPQYPSTKKVVDYEINLVKGKKGRAFFVPGNHDWKGGKMGGWERVMNQVNYINSLQAQNIQAWPLNGCPGPVPVELSDKVVLVMMDTQWFLHVHDKPGPESSCTSRTIDEFTAQLREIVNTHQNQLLILVMHHPLYTYGIHGGAYGLRQHIFPFAEAIKGLYIPLPVLGSVYPLARGLFGSLQDTYHPLYRSMINNIEEVLKEHPNPVAVAGHEHSLQLIIKDSIPYIVSGSAAKLTRLRKGKNSVFSVLTYGFSIIEIRKSGKVEIKFFTLGSAGLANPVFEKQLKPVFPPVKRETIDTLLPVFKEVQVAAGERINTNAFQQFFWGENYRKEWLQPVSVSMLNLGTEQGGLKPIGQSGVFQTKILRLSDKSGKEWILRAIEKFPEVVIPSDLRTSFSASALDKGVSGSYPFASLSVSVLEQASGIPTVRRKLVYVPDDPRLERFRNGFKNNLSILEEREPYKVGKTYNTEELMLKLEDNASQSVDQTAVLKARLLDNFILDFDRHEGQWRWATKDTGTGKLYFPIAGERDQAFFINEGFLSGFLRKPWFIPQIQGFRPRAINIKTFNKTARNFDRYFLTKLSEDDWKNTIDSFLASMSDETIEKSMLQQPSEIQSFNALKIAATLKERRKYFRMEMMNYYRFISRIVTVVGTNQRELYTINTETDGKVSVAVDRIEKNGTISTRFYQRMFDPRITKEIRVFALGSNDTIVIKGRNSKIRIRIIGGSGADQYVNKGEGQKVTIYDASFENNQIEKSSQFKDRTSADPEVNRYTRSDFKYDFIDPGAIVEYNRDDGLSISLSLQYFKQGFRKEPYSMRQFLSYNKALRTGANFVRYESDYIKSFGNLDIGINGELKGPDYVANFFGIGNNSTFDKSKSGASQYYRAHYTLGTFSVFGARQLQSWMRVGGGPTIQYFSINPEEQSGKVLADLALSGYDGSNPFGRKIYLGATGQIDINSRNNPDVPTRGALIHGYVRPLFGLNKSSSRMMQTELDVRIFMSFLPQTKFVFAARFGIAGNFGHYEFPQAQYLSGTKNLRGFRRDRFAGRSMAFNNSELRWKLANFATYVFNGSLGFLGFHDIGRVWTENEKSQRWYNGYGGGIWIAPITRIVVVGSLAFSKEEKALPLITFGFQF